MYSHNQVAPKSPRRPSVPFTPEQDKILFDQYAHATIHDLIAQIKRPAQDIFKRANRLGLKKATKAKPVKEYTEWEDNLLKKEYGKMPITELARQLDVSGNTVLVRAFQLGLIGNGYKISLKETLTHDPRNVLLMKAWV
ncbi:hypothetical protein [Parendozoicomonas haliclonae]|uniref:Uncharacterized protein n=1 Tax=Parendozoicomonas haliclonae TaxID=1960125 RepID=A0A1X7AE62_9GAMM|nr:hypothetical protein [Parendozoicomonas haliclonae]SMA33187.1 hypothetical protein EHSB41UT_00237 [Parendozoicomonas haliclonae]